MALDERTGDKREYSVLKRLADSGRTPEDECRIYELNARVRTFAAQLSPTLRRTFQLLDVDGLSISETARILGIPSSTVKAQLARARAKLKKSMRRSLERRPRVAKHGQKVTTDHETNLARDSVYAACVAEVTDPHRQVLGLRRLRVLLCFGPQHLGCCADEACESRASAFCG